MSITSLIYPSFSSFSSLLFKINILSTITPKSLKFWRNISLNFDLTNDKSNFFSFLFNISKELNRL